MSIINVDNNLSSYSNPTVSTYINEYINIPDENSNEGDVKFFNDSLYVYKNGKYCMIDTVIHMPNNQIVDPVTEQLKDWYISYKDTQVNELNLLKKYPEARKAREIYESILKSLMAMEAITDGNCYE